MGRDTTSSMPFTIPFHVKWPLFTGGLVLVAGLLLTLIVSFRTSTSLDAAARASLARVSQREIRDFQNFLQAKEARAELLAGDRLVERFLRYPSHRNDLRTVLRAHIAALREREPWLSNFLVVRQNEIVHEDLEIPAEVREPLLKRLAMLKPSEVAVEPSSVFGPLEPAGVSIIIKKPLPDLNDGNENSFVVLVLNLGRINSDLRLKPLESLDTASVVFGKVNNTIQTGLLSPAAPIDVFQGVQPEDVPSIADAHAVLADVRQLPESQFGILSYQSRSLARQPLQGTIHFLVLATLALAAAAAAVGSAWSATLSAAYDRLLKRIGARAGSHIPSHLRAGHARSLEHLSEACEEVTTTMNQRIEDLEFLKSAMEKLSQMRTLGDLSQAIDKPIRSYLGLTDAQVFCSLAPLEDYVLNGRVIDPRRDDEENREQEYLRFLRRSSNQVVHGVIIIPSLNARRSDVRRLRNLVDSLADLAETATENICATREEVERDRRLASQKLERALVDILHAQPYPVLSGYDLSGAFRPGLEPGGTWHGAWLSHSEKELRIYLGDATGHGPLSALISTGAMAIISTLESEAARQGRDELDAEAILQNLDTFIRNVGQQKFLMTFCICTIELASGKITFVNAGNKQPFIVPPGAEPAPDQIRFVTSIGNRLGWVQPGDRPPIYQHRVTTLQPGECLVLYADGTISVRDPEGNKLGLHHLQQVCQRYVGKSPRQMTEAILSDLTFFQKGDEFRDDVNLILLKRWSQ